MAKNDIDPELMGRVAERMEESGRALKTIQSQLNDHGARVSAAEIKLDSAHARIKKLEDAVNGNGSKGLKTDIELAKSGLKNLEEDIKELKKNPIASDAPKSTSNLIIAIAAIVIALGSMVSSCGPQWIKAMSPNPPAEINSDG